MLQSKQQNVDKFDLMPEHLLGVVFAMDTNVQRRRYLGGGRIKCGRKAYASVERQRSGKTYTAEVQQGLGGGVGGTTFASI